MKLSVRNIFFIIAVVAEMSVCTSCSDGYKIIDGKVVHKEWTFSFGEMIYELEGADCNSFEGIKGGYGHDNKHAWYHQYLLEGADGATFRYMKHGYARDEHLVFLKEKRVVCADAQTFRIHSKYFAEDKRDFYWDGYPLFVADKASFRLCGKDDDEFLRWGKDRQYAYYLLPSEKTKAGHRPERVRIADYNSFGAVEMVDTGSVVCSGHYAKDNVQVYYCDAVVPGADSKTIKEVEWDIAEDANGVYFAGKRVKARHFSDLRKKGRFYYGYGRIYTEELEQLPESAEASTISFITTEWCKDSKHVYWHGKTVEGANPATFTTWSHYLHETMDSVPESLLDKCDGYGRDANHIYFHDKIVSEGPKDK